MNNDVVAPAGPLNGVRVIEFASMVAGPYCGQMLADMGAEVIKIEDRHGDGLRAVRPEHAGLGALFAHNNRGKKSVVIDLKSNEGRELCQELVKEADVVLENFRPGVMTRLGLDYRCLQEINSQLIYVNVTGFGNSGPYAERPAYDQVIQALTGAMWGQGEYRSPEPVRNPIVDKISAVTACCGTLAALYHRAKTGEGQEVNVSLLDAYSAFIMPGLTNNHTFIGADLALYPPRAVFQVIKTLDGQVMGYVQTDAQWDGCLRAFRRQDLIDDARFSNPKDRLTHVKEMWAEMAKGAEGLTTAQIMDVAITSSVPIARVNTVEEFILDPQAQHNEVFVNYSDAAVGALRQVNFPVRFSRTPANAQSRAPRLGEDTEEVLSSLGLDQAAIATLSAAGRIMQGSQRR